jgi:hypothetical protein
MPRGAAKARTALLKIFMAADGKRTRCAKAAQDKNLHDYRDAA